MTSIELLAPAKVNLYLKVLNRRRDSYHNILTVFERISLADEISISKIPKGIEVISDKVITKNPEDNLAYKAANLVLRLKKVKSGVRIRIKKRIPIASGLGGGSSDAASVLMAMDRLFSLKIEKHKLMRLARRIGSDVPFFVLNRSFAMGTSWGDALKPIALKSVLWHLLIYPGFGVSTREIYDAFDTSTSLSINPEHSRRVDFALTKKPDGVKIKTHLKNPMDFGAAESMLHNDLENIAILKKSVIGKIKERLACILGKNAILSGSGPSLFCLYRTRKEAMGGKKMFLSGVPARDKKDWQVFVVRTC